MARGRGLRLSDRVRHHNGWVSDAVLLLPVRLSVLGVPSPDPSVSANLNLVRSIYAALARGDFSSTAWAHPEIEYVVVGGPEPVSVRGVDGMVDVVRAIFADIEDDRDEAEEYRELDHERVLVLSKISGRGRSSGAHFVQKIAALFEIHDGKVTRLVAYPERDRALAELAPDTGT